MQCLPLLERTMQKLVTLSFNPKVLYHEEFSTTFSVDFSRFSILGGFESIIVVFVMLFSNVIELLFTFQLYFYFCSFQIVTFFKTVKYIHNAVSTL